MFSVNWMAEGNILKGTASNEKLLALAFLFCGERLVPKYITKTVNTTPNTCVAGTYTVQTQPAPQEFGHLLP